MDKKGDIRVVKPCDNCNAMGPCYGKVPFEKYDGALVKDAISNHLEEARLPLKKATADFEDASNIANCTQALNIVTKNENPESELKK